MKLYYSAGACSLSVRIILLELGLSCDYVAVDLAKKTTENGDDYYKINPKGAVPALQLSNGEVLTENIAIHLYLAETHHADALLPAEKRYQVIEWLSFVATDLHKSTGILFSHMLSDELKQTIFIPLLKKKLDFLAVYLEGKTYLVNDQFTIVDSYCFVILSWLKFFKITLKNWPALSEYFERIEKRASVQQAMAAERVTT